nr:MAG TPA: hypothetical protein [Crassvirales sp.]
MLIFVSVIWHMCHNKRYSAFVPYRQGLRHSCQPFFVV